MDSWCSCYAVAVEDLGIIVKLKRGPKPEIVAYLPGKELRRLMRQYRVTIRELSQRMGITQKRIRLRREIGLEGRELIRDWVQEILGYDPGPLPPPWFAQHRSGL